MAKKKASKPRARSTGKMGAKAGGKKKPVASKTAKKASGAAKAVAHHAGAGRPPGHHRQMRIGLSRNGNNPPPFHVGGANTFTIYGDSLGVGNPNRKRVRPRATNHTWQDATNIQNAGRDALQVTAVCSARIRKKRPGNGSDDLTVTVSLDGTDETDCVFEDVDYDA